MRTLLLSLLLFLSAQMALAQNYRLSFMSKSDAKFFLYLNGKLQNERSSGHVTLTGLENKDYHIRIVIDDPYQVASTKTIRPDGKHTDYSVEFNVVRERVYIREERPGREKPQENMEEESVSIDVSEAPETPTPQRPSLRFDPLNDSTPLPHINRVRSRVEEL